MQSATLVSGGTSRYLQEIRRFPMLQAEEESVLAKRCVTMATPMPRTSSLPATCVWW